MQHLLIVTCGGSGSTLLQRVLNSFSQVYIKGENKNAYYHLFKSYSEFEYSQKIFGDKAQDNAANPWFDIKKTNLNSYRESLISIIKESIIEGHAKNKLEYCGFVETRYFEIFKGKNGNVELESFLSFLFTGLSPCKILFLHRDEEEVLSSRWGKQHSSNTLSQQLKSYKVFFQNFSKNMPSNCYHISYQDIVTRRLDGLFCFLNIKPDYELIEASLKGSRDHHSNENVNSKIIEGDKLYLQGDKEKAIKLYDDYINNIKSKPTEQQKVPFYICRRSDVQSYLVRTSVRHQLAYFPVPKCACTSISHLIFEIENGKKFSEIKNNDDMRIHKYYKNIAELNLNHYNDYFKFTVVRDPIERFISGYKNRILFHQDFNKFITKHEEIPSLNNFAINIKRYLDRNNLILRHFEPVTIRLGHDINLFDKVYLFEELSLLEEQLSERTKLDLELGHFQTGGKSFSFTRNDLTDEAIKSLHGFYKDDYKFLKNHYEL